MYRKISDDLKEAALRLKARGHDTNYEISQITGFSTRTLYRACRHKLLTGSVAPAQWTPPITPQAQLRLPSTPSTTQTNPLS
jgi:hypothetical protein